MIIDLQRHLDTLRERHGTITVAVCKLGDAASIVPAGIEAIQLPNERMTYVVSHGDTQVLSEFLSSFNITPGWWVQLREYDHYVPRHHRPDLDEINGDLVEVQMGALDQLFGYIAVQTKQAEYFDYVFERVQDELASGRRQSRS